MYTSLLHRRFLTSAWLGAATLLTLSAHAQTVPNPSFEVDATGPGTSVTSVPSGWTSFNEASAADIGSQNAGGSDYSVFDPLAPTADGNQFCYINMFNPSVTGGIYVDAGPMTTNTVYTLTVAIGSRADRINSPGIISLIKGSDNTGTVVASGGGLPASQDSWQDYTVSFTNGTSTADLTVALSVIGNGTTIQADFDNVRLTSAPGTTPPPALAVINPSFENDTVAPGAAAPYVPTGWSAFNQASPGDIGSQNAGGADYTVYDPLAAPADGNQFCYVNMFNPSVTGGIYQDIGAMQPGAVYTLTVAIGSRADRINSPGIISLISGTDYTGTVLATTNGLPGSQDTWQDYSVSFTNSSSTNDLTIVLSVLGDGTSIQADFDNVRLTSSTGATAPKLGAPMISGGNLILTGTGGSPGGTYTLLTTTNLATPLPWTTATTGTFSSTGSFTNSIPVGTGQARFFVVRVP